MYILHSSKCYIEILLLDILWMPVKVNADSPCLHD